MNNKRLTKKEKAIVAAIYPMCSGFATREEVRSAKKKARGHYWYDRDFEEVCAISVTGRRHYFECLWWEPTSEKNKKEWRNIAYRCAKLWTKGKYKESLRIFDEQTPH